MYPNWKQLLKQEGSAWAQVLAEAKQGAPFVLMCSTVGAHGPVITHDSYLAAALLARGARVEALLCDGALPACELCTIYNLAAERLETQGPQGSHCGPCYQSGQSCYSSLGLPVHTYKAFLDPADDTEAAETVASVADDELRSFMLDDVALGEEAFAGALRYFATGDLLDEPRGTAVLRRYLQAAIVALRAIQRMFDTLRPDVAVFHHGIYVPQGILGRVARQRGIRVVNWSVGYRKQTFVYSHDDTYHRTMIDEPVSAWRERELSSAERSRLITYLDSRRNSSEDWIKFNQEPEENDRIIRQRLGLDERPFALLLTNVTWDAQLYYKSNGFPSLIDWLTYSIRAFGQRDDMQLVIRVHPGEVRGTMVTRQPVMESIARRMPELPANVRVVPAASDLSTYALAEMADCTIIFGTKTGVELTARGLPVIVAGEAWIRNKGLTIDVSCEEEYHNLLAKLPLRRKMEPEQTELALRYAYHYFFRRLVPLRALTEVNNKGSLQGTLRRISGKIATLQSPALIKSPYEVTINGLADLRPGSDDGLDVVCGGILNGEPFIY
jgi:hypothetical protein